VNLEESTFLSRARYQKMKLSCYLIPRSLYTRSSHQDELMLVVRYQEGVYSELRSAMM
jgi:hypothetical protein